MSTFRPGVCGKIGAMLDTIIIGAGPAGCVGAILLARGGKSVRLIERHRFPRDKVCGECLSALGHQTLEHLGISDAFQQLKPVKLARCCIHPVSGRSIDIELPVAMWGISRLRFDAWLLDAASEAGAEIFQPARCEQVEPRIRVRDLQRNALREMDAQWVLLADGKRALLESRPAPTSDLGVKAHFTNITGRRDAIELFGVDGHYGGLAPIEDGRWNAAFSVPQRRVRMCDGDLDAMFAQIVSENAVLRERFRSAQRCSEWLASPLPRFSVPARFPRNIIPIGNAAGAIEPIGGEGMGLAMRSAVLAAEMLLSSDVDLELLQARFRKLWRTRSISCRAVARLISEPKLARWIAASLRHAGPLARVVMSSMGK